MTMNAIAIAIGAGARPPFLPSNLPNLAAWYRYGQGITVVTGVSQWNDASGNGRNLLQATVGFQPALQGDGSILFDGIDDFLKAAPFTLNQPLTVYLRFKQIAWGLNGGIFDGNVAASTVLFQNATTPNLRIYAGTNSTEDPNIPTNTYVSMACVFNGASSITQVNNNAAITSAAGAQVAGGFTLGCRADPAFFTNIQVKEIPIYAAAHDQATRDRVLAYLTSLG